MYVKRVRQRLTKPLCASSSNFAGMYTYNHHETVEGQR